MQVTYAPDEHDELRLIIWLRENPKDPQFEPHARIKMVQVLGSPLYICGITQLFSFWSKMQILFQIVKNLLVKIVGLSSCISLNADNSFDNRETSLVPGGGYMKRKGKWNRGWACKKNSWQKKVGLGNVG